MPCLKASGLVLLKIDLSLNIFCTYVLLYFLNNVSSFSFLFVVVQEVPQPQKKVSAPEIQLEHIDDGQKPHIRYMFGHTERKQREIV